MLDKDRLLAFGLLQKRTQCLKLCFLDEKDITQLRYEKLLGRTKIVFLQHVCKYVLIFKKVLFANKKIIL